MSEAGQRTEANMGDLVERLRTQIVLHEEPPITVILNGVEMVCPGGQTIRLRNPDGPEAADEIERLRARVAELEAFAREVTGV